MAEKIFLLEDDAYLRDGLLEMLQGREIMKLKVPKVSKKQR